MSTDVIDQAVKFLRDHLASNDVKVGSSHAHAAVSHYLGYNSKAALKADDDFDVDDVDLIINRKVGLDKLRVHIPKMQPNALQTISIDELGEIIYAGLAPACECCNEKKLDIMPLGCDESSPDGWVSLSCAAQDEEYDVCDFCGPNYLYRSRDINRRGECSEHEGESILDDEDLDDE